MEALPTPTDIMGLSEPDQIANLSKLDVNSLLILTRLDPEIDALIRSRYVLEDLAKAHNLPSPKDFEELQDYLIMDSDSLIMRCAQDGHIGKIEESLHKPLKSYHWSDVITTAAKYGHADIVKMILLFNDKSEILDNCVGMRVGNAMKSALENKRVDAYNILLDYTENNMDADDQTDALIISMEGAASIGDLEEVKNLMARIQSKPRSRPIMYRLSGAINEARNHKHTDVVEYLFNEGALEDPLSSHYHRAPEIDQDLLMLEKALERASYRGNIGIIQYLVNSGRIRKLSRCDLKSACIQALDGDHYQIASILMKVLKSLQAEDPVSSD